AALFRPARIAPVATGRAVPRARPWLAISTARACATMRRRDRGIHRIPRAGPTAAVVKAISEGPAASVVKAIWGGPAVTGYSFASLPNKPFARFGMGTGPCRPGYVYLESTCS